MDFPAYVPAAVRAHITTLLDGDDWEPQGWAATLANAEKKLAEIEAVIETRTRRGETEYLDGLRKQKKDATKHRDRLAGDVDCLHRLAHDLRMRDAYAKLAQEFTLDEQWRSFIRSAWAARLDYSKYRDQLKRTAELRDKIAETSEKLAGLLKATSDTGFPFWPPEFFDIPELLRQTDNHEMQNHNLGMWRSVRPYVLGDPPERDVSEIEKVDGEQPSAPKKEDARSILPYAWSIAPDLSALLDTVAKAARSFQPSESGMVGAAIQSRQRSRAGNKEYLRAFGNLLTEVNRIAPTINVMNAMAITATVVINDRDFVVTYDDVIKANGKPIETRA